MSTLRTISHQWCLAFWLTAALFIGPRTRADLLEHWTTNQVSNKAWIDCVVYGSGRYVAYGEYSDFGMILSSEDGLRWTVRVDGDVSFSTGLCFSGNKFFALGGFGTSAVSSNGLDWTVFSLPNNATPAGVAYSGFRFVAVGDAGGTFSSDLNISTSPDGLTWTARHSTSPNGASLGDVAYGAGTFVALGNDYGFTNDLGHSYTATSLGLTWTQHSIPGGRYIAFSKGIFIVPLSGTNLISADGLAWAMVPTGITNTLGKVVYYNGLFMARADRWLASSADGTNWVRYAHEIPGNSFRQPDLATDGKMLVTVGIGGSFMNYQGFIYTCDELTTLSISPAPLGTLIISGLVGRTNRIEFANSLQGAGLNGWQAMTNVRLEVQPAVVSDPSAQGAPQRFYRSTLIP